MTDTPTLSQRATHAHEQTTRARQEADRPRMRYWLHIFTILVTHKRGPRFCCEPDGRCWDLARALRLTDDLTSAAIR